MLNVLVLGTLGWLLAWFFISDRFYVNQVVVRGNQRVSAETIALTSNLKGYSVFWIDAGQVAASITEALPPITEVRVRCALPNNVVLTVEEQGEEVMWLVAGNRYWVDDDGHFHPAQGGDDPRLLVRDVRASLPSQVDIGAVIAARQLTAVLPELTSVEYAPNQGLYFAHARGWVVYLGTGDDMSEKVKVLRAIEQGLSIEEERQPSSVDVRFPANPYLRYPGE